ncbi:MAG TPA: (2Fe-2S)-binding protein [Nannocystaceae bacterium]|nr:(2Fe-2S)-binding protein [Nannocystaceae bacterium]
MGRLLCHCLVVEEGEVRKAIRAGARTVEAVGERCEAGTGCGSCRAGITVLLADEARRRARRGVEAEAFAALAGQIGLFGERPATPEEPELQRDPSTADDPGQ